MGTCATSSIDLEQVVWWSYPQKFPRNMLAFLSLLQREPRKAYGTFVKDVVFVSNSGLSYDRVKVETNVHISIGSWPR